MACDWSIAEAAKWIENRQLSPVELMQAVLDRIKTLEPGPNRFGTLSSMTSNNFCGR